MGPRLTRGAQVLADPGLQEVLPSLRSLCAQAECRLEANWAERIAAGADGADVYRRLWSFPYYANYEQLARLGLCAVGAVGAARPRRVAFVGSGPLPLTSLCLLAALRDGADADADAAAAATVLNVDRDGAAIALSRALSRRLGARAAGAAFVCAEAGSDAVRLAGFDVVYLAALVGSSQADKEAVVARVAAAMSPGALLVVRSSWGLRTCLYPDLDVASGPLLRCLDVCLVVHPYGDVFNSVVVARVKPRPREQ